MKISRSLIAVLTDPPDFSFQADNPDLDITVNGKIYEDSGLGRSIGFYDWLRTPTGRVIGVRTWVSRSSTIHGFRRGVASNSAIEWSDTEIKLFFSAKRDFDNTKSDDQEFGVHRLVATSDGLLALTYNVDLLSEDELADLTLHVEGSAQQTPGRPVDRK